MAAGGGGAGGLPIDVRQVLTLPSLGVPADSINFRSASMSSAQAICVKEGASGKMAIVNTQNAQVNRRPLSGEAAILSPDQSMIAVRGKGAMQLFNMNLGKRVKAHKLPEGDKVAYWTWISNTTVAFVTGSAAFHWSTEGDAAPAKMFDRHANLAGCQVISYGASADNKWLCVSGIKAGPQGGPAIGSTQLYSVDRRVSQSLASHVGCFCTAKPNGRADSGMLFCFVDHKVEAGEKPKLQAIEVGRAREAGPAFRLAPKALPVPADAAADFASAIRVSPQNDIVYVFTKGGYVYVFDLHSGGVIFRHKMSTAPVFATAAHEQSGGVLALNVKLGEMFLVNLNKDNLVPYIMTTLRNQELALSLAGRLGLAGADDVYRQRFEALLGSGDVDQAAQLAAKSPGVVIRNAATIQRLQQMPNAAGGPPPIMRYFTTLMKAGKLNRVESVEIARPALAQGRASLIERWLGEEKLECSAELGDLVVSYDPKLAQRIYLNSGDAHEKVIQTYMSTGEVSEIIPYATKYNYTPNYQHILQGLVHQRPKDAQDFAIRLVKNPGGPLIQIDNAVDIFMQFQRLQECSSFLLDVLSEDRKEQGYLQTRLLELNLMNGAPQVADAILGSSMFHHFNANHIASLCEQSGLPHRAMELYEDTNDVKRCMAAAARNPEQHANLTKFFGQILPETGRACLAELLKDKTNEALAVKVATEFSDEMNPEELIAIFEAAKSTNGLFYYLGGIVNTSENPEVHFKYIQAAAQLKQMREVERVCRDSTVYDAARVKQFLIDAKLPDPRALIHVCDRHGYIDELTTYLYSTNRPKLHKFIEVYVVRVSPRACPKVVGRLIDLDCDEQFIKSIIGQVPTGITPTSLPEGAPVPNLCNIGELVEEVERRNRLRVLQPWLEQKANEGNSDQALHNAIGKIYVTINKEPQEFLRNNQYYDSEVLGKFCEKLDPYLAFLAYKRADGACDELLIDVTNKNGLFKDQARYLVEKRDPELWKKVLEDDNPHRQELVDQVIGTALPESDEADEVSATVKAFMEADLPQHLIGLLEKLVLQGGQFADNRNLQNLLILTAIRCNNAADAEPGRPMKYITRLDNFDGAEIAEIALRPEYGLYDEAFTIYKKFSMDEEAVAVLIDNKADLDAAFEFAERVHKPEVWTRLGRAQIEQNEVKEGVDSFIHAKFTAEYESVITAAHEVEAWEDLVRFLEMCREEDIKERRVDTELVYALAQCNRLADLEAFITSPNVADIQGTGDRLFEAGEFDAARILFASISNNAMLASCFVRLGRFRDAVEAARKANSLRTWTEVNHACVREKEFKLAQQCGLHIIMSPDHLEELILHYEEGGHAQELMKLLEIGLGNDGAHSGIFTELAVLYSRHRPESLMQHIRDYQHRLNVSKVLRACEAGRHWSEAAFLHIGSEDFDSAVKVMIEHSPTAFQAERFLEVVRKVRNQELYYQSIEFFLQEDPDRLERLLTVLTPVLDHARVVHKLRKTDDALLLAMPYLRSVQRENISAVNEAINEVLVDEEEYEALRESIDLHDNFDQLELAQQLESHELLEFRRIAAYLYKRNRRYEQSMELSKADGIFKDAIDTAAASDNSQLVVKLLRWFVDTKSDRECFAACLFTCFHLVPPDVALELAWRSRSVDYAMPYLVQYLKNADAKIKELEERTKPAEEDAADAGLGAAAMPGAPPVLGGAALLTNYSHAEHMGMPQQQPQQAAYGGAAAGYGQVPQPGMPGTAQPMDVYTMGGATTS